MTYIGYDTWIDFEAILSGRGMVDTDSIPQIRREQIITEYPYGEFDVDADDADIVWQQTGGPWFDKLEDQLVTEGYGREI